MSKANRQDRVRLFLDEGPPPEVICMLCIVDMEVSAHSLIRLTWREIERHFNDGVVIRPECGYCGAEEEIK